MDKNYIVWKIKNIKNRKEAFIKDADFYHREFLFQILKKLDNEIVAWEKMLQD